jgi:SAM-dependent methyltransferase
MDPVAAYDQIAPLYAAIAAQRHGYIEAVDRLVIAAIPAGSRSLLDVGAGDGSRSRRIAASCGITDLVMLEPSVAMQQGSAGDFRTMRAEELDSLRSTFDVITCLWNVLGHVSRRAEVLGQFARLLSPQGRIFLDLSHRYNVSHYGLLPTAARFLYDHLSPGETNGDVEVAWNGRCVTKGHVFTHREVQSLCGAAGLRIEKRFVIDYATGQHRRWAGAGHLLYVLAR